MNDAKYIGLDVHQATISAAVLDSTGHLVMESILETKAATILQFIHGLRGSLHVTFEEGTCAAWLHDLLKPHVTKVLVCDPRKNALLKAGNKNDRIDARKLADLLRSGLLSAVYHGENGVRTLKELARSYLAVTQDLTRVMNRLKALYRSWAIPCAGERVYAPRHRSEWLAKITEAGVRRRAEFYYQQLDALQASASAGSTRSVGGEQEAQRDEIAAPDSFDRSDSGGSADCSDSDAASFSHQAATLGLQRSGFEDFHQRRIPRSARTAQTLQEAAGDPRAQRQSQSRSEKYLQGCGDQSRCRSRTVPGVLRRAGCQRDETADGAPHPGAEDCGNHFAGLEERSAFRRRTSETTSSLSVCREPYPSLDSSQAVACRFLRRSGSRVSIHNAR